MITLLLLAVAQAQVAPLLASDVPVSYVVSVVADDGECRFLPTDVGLTARQLTATLKSYNRSNGVVLIFYSDVPSDCIKVGRKAALAAGFTSVTARPATAEDEGHGRVR
jgi:hypothetical protein